MHLNKITVCHFRRLADVKIDPDRGISFFVNANNNGKTCVGRSLSDINRLIDVMAPDQKTCVSVLGNFKHVVKPGHVRQHPIIARLVDKETLEKMRVTWRKKPVLGNV